jgi:hypothetical protein
MTIILRGKPLYETLVQEQEAWIKECTETGFYNRETGQLLLNADQKELERLRQKLRKYNDKSPS